VSPIETSIPSPLKTLSPSLLEESSLRLSPLVEASSLLKMLTLSLTAEVLSPSPFKVLSPCSSLLVKILSPLETSDSKKGTFDVWITCLQWGILKAPDSGTVMDIVKHE